MTGMVTERDFRKLAPATQAELRRIAVAMVRAGKTRLEAAATVGVNRRFVGRWVQAAARRGGLSGRAAGPSSGRAESAERGAGRGIALPDRPGVPRSVWSVVCAVDAPRGAGADRARDRGVAEPVGGWRLSARLGLHRAAADAASHRAAG